jgi:hypothetical protein
MPQNFVVLLSENHMHKNNSRFQTSSVNKKIGSLVCTVQIKTDAAAFTASIGGGSHIYL